MDALARMNLADVQAAADTRGMVIDRVGIKGVRYPVRVRSGSGAEQPTTGLIDMYVQLPAGVKGTHMSRFIETLDALDEPLDFAVLARLMDRLLGRLEASHGQIDIHFPYFIRKRAPVSGVESLMDYDVRLSARAGAPEGLVCRLEVCVPATSLCPCSKQISDYGAHNQRSHLRIAAELRAAISIEELVEMAERAASCEVYGLLKRPDEKYVTERAFDNPKFVEDLVRDIAVSLEAERRVSRYLVSAENFESIHNHSAYAQIERDKNRDQEQTRDAGRRRDGEHLIGEIA